MRLLILLFVLIFASCANEKIETVVVTSDENQVEEISDSLIYTLDQIHDDFSLLELGCIFFNTDFFQLTPFPNETLVANCLKANLPGSALKDWICNNKKLIGEDDWFQIRPIGLMKSDSTLHYIIATYEQVSQEGEEYADYWCLTSKDRQTICSVTNIGYTGMYPKTEKGEEKGASYSIKTTEIEKLDIKFLQLDSIIAISQQHTIRNGFDWRVDQNLNINDSVAMPAVTKVYNLID